TETNETETNETETNETETNETETNETETNETETNETETNETLTTSSGAPNPPANLQATQISQNRINLSWSASTDSGELPLVGYKIESKTSDESDYTILVTNTGSPSITTYSHTGLTAGLTYDYRISAINSDGESNPSDVVTATIEVTGGSTGTSNEQEGGLSQQPQTTDPLQPVQVTLSTDKPTYNPNDSITISGTTDSSSQTVPLGMRVVSPDGAIVYVRSISIDNNGSFEIIISSAQRQSSAWQSDGEFKVEVTQNGRIQATTTFTNDGVGDSSSLSSDDATDPTNQQQSPLPVPGVNPPGDESPTLSNDEFETIKTQNTALQSANQQLHDENNQLKLQIKDLNEKIEQLDIIIKEQVRVMLETLGIS
ncbi:MAG: fibronectin type III domain-containing protein, partial [Nitrosopumilus sp.]